MHTVTIRGQADTPTGWRFVVGVEENGDQKEYEVELDKTYWQKLTKEKDGPADLVIRSFRFLLTRESKESILSSFNISVIADYFPEYEEATATT